MKLSKNMNRKKLSCKSLSISLYNIKKFFFSIFLLFAFSHSPFKFICLPSRWIAKLFFFRALHIKKKRYCGIRLCLALPGCAWRRQQKRVHRTTEICTTELKEIRSHARAYAYAHRCRPLQRRLEHSRGRVVISFHWRETAFLPCAAPSTYKEGRNFQFAAHIRSLHFSYRFAYRLIREL